MATKTFMIFRNTDKKSENSPDYRLCIRSGEDEEGMLTVGALWKKQGPNSTYLSGKLDDAYQDKEGMWMMTDTEKKQAESYRRTNKKSISEDVEEPQVDYPEDEDITPEDIPF